MIKMNVGVVILNYLAYKTTIECVESLKKQIVDDVNIRIVIVDNYSPNESYEELLNKYDADEIVDVIKTEENLGFAKGNNLGYQYLKKKLDMDFVICCNDDILFPQQGLFLWIDRMNSNYKFDVLGPDIYSVRGNFHQSPMENYSTDVFKCRIKLLKNRYHLLKIYVKKILRIPSKTFNAVWDDKYFSELSDDMTLHGSFQIFSKSYFSHYDEPYDPRTFLYMEEYILRARCNKYKLKMIYSPEYKVNHLQAVSTNMITVSSIEKMCRRKKCEIESMKVYIQVLLGK